MKEARAQGVSFAEFVRRAVAAAVKKKPSAADLRNRRAALAAMKAFGDEGPGGPADLAKNLDDYLYGPIRKSKS